MAAQTTAADPFDLPELRDQAPPARPGFEAPEASAVDAPPAERSDEPAYAPHPDMATSIAAQPLHAPVPEAEADPAPPPALGLRRAGAAPAIDAPRPTGLSRLLLALRTTLTGRQPGMPRLQAVFSRDFIWPLTPPQVARWAQRHGQAQTLAPADWPRRQVDTDGQRLAQARQKGLAHTLQLHLLTAAIGVGDRRIRVLMDAQGAVIGPRAYSRPRVAGATSLLMAGMLAVGWGLWRPAHEVGTDVAVAAALVASAPAAAAAAAASATDGPASMPGTVAAGAAGVAPVAAMVLPPAASMPEAPAAATASAPEAPHPASAEPTAQAPDLPQPPGPASSKPEQPVARIRPTLSTEQRQVARLQGERLRTSPPAAATAPAPVYAVVTRPSRERESAVRGLALMRDSSRRLPPPLPDHGELMRSQGEWRAAWWPFASLADAERARVMLNGRGLKAEVVAF